MLTSLKSLLCDEAGDTMVEYGLLIACIALAALIAVQTLGHNVTALFRTSPSSVAAGG
jgi:Flp pilus assembly pilin Flp